MATLKPLGYEYEFVDQVPEDFFCKLCKHVARESTITSCCIEVLCKACMDAIVQDKKPCPGCESNDIKVLGPHVRYQRKILALEVRCTMKDRGCPWTGQLQHLDAHLDVTTGDCQYVDVECPKKCVQKVQKRYVDTHLANECPNRDYRCPHCNFANKFHVVSDHFDICPYYPLACPNRCGATFERDDLQDHMKMCRLEEVQCVFDNAGCQAKFIRENEDEHMDQNTQKHLALMPAATLRISQDFEQKLQEEQEMFGQKLQEQQEVFGQKLQEQQEVFGQKLQEQQEVFGQKLQEQQEVFEKKLEQKDEQIKQVEQKLQEQEVFERKLEETIEQKMYNLQQQIDQLAAYHPSSANFTIDNFQQEKAKKSFIESPPAYSEPNGCKFMLGVFPSGEYTHKGTHVSVGVYSVKGDHDAELKLPVKFTISLQLLNQHRNEDHHTRDIPCIVNWDRFGRGKNYSVGKNWAFIPHAALEWNRDKQTQYLKDDCLKFRITKIVAN